MTLEYVASKNSYKNLKLFKIGKSLKLAELCQKQEEYFLKCTNNFESHLNQFSSIPF